MNLLYGNLRDYKLKTYVGNDRAHDHCAYEKNRPQINYIILLNVITKDVRILKIFVVNCFAMQNLCA